MEEKKCNCGHDHVHDENCECGADDEQAIVTLTLEDDTQVECHVLGTFDVEDNEYIAVLPLESDEALIYKYKEVDDEVELTSIDSDEEFNMVSEVFYSFFDDEFEDDDEFEEYEDEVDDDGEKND